MAGHVLFPHIVGHSDAAGYRKRRDTSMMAGISWAIPKVKRLTLSGQLAFDTGELYGDNFGGMLTLRYSLPVFRKNNT